MKEVRVYTRPDCRYCDYAKELLTEAGIPFRECSVRMENGEEDDIILGWLRWETGQKTLPQIFIGGDSIGGYADLMTLSATGELARLVGKAGAK